MKVRGGFLASLSALHSEREGSKRRERRRRRHFEERRRGFHQGRGRNRERRERNRVGSGQKTSLRKEKESRLVLRHIKGKKSLLEAK